MGFFANLYIVEADATDRAVKARTTIYGSEIGPVAYFCWGPGERPPGLHAYAGGTVQCDAELKPLPGYPLIETVGTTPDEALIEANFRPRHGDDPVLFHFVLPERFIPRRNLKPLDQPMRPFVYASGERIVATYPVVGQATIRFRITGLRDSESIADYEHEKLLHPEEERSVKVGVEFNFGVFKIKVG